MYLFRTNYKGQDVSNGIFAKNPAASIRLADFVHSANRGGEAANSQWVALSKSFSVVLSYTLGHSATCGGIAFIDAEAFYKLDIETHDLSVKTEAERLLKQPEFKSAHGEHKASFYTMAANFAAASAEVDCVPGSDGIPRSIYKYVTAEEVDAAYRKVWDPWLGKAKNNANLIDYLMKIAH